MTGADLEALGFDDSGSPDPGRLEMLDFLRSHGVTPQEIALAESEGRVSSILTDRLTGQPTLTIEEAAAQSGLSAEFISRVWRAAGLPDPGTLG